MHSDLPGLSRISEPPVIGDPFVQLTATRAHLRFVFMMRNLLLLAVCLAMAVAVLEGGSSWVSMQIAAVVALAGVLNLLTWLRLRQPEPVSHGEFLGHILADVALLSAALCFSGGDASPFNGLYLLPLMIGAATLPWRHAVVVAFVIMGSRELACEFQVQLPGPPTPDRQVVELLVGVLIAYFVFCMARTSRRHDRLLARIREDYLKQRHSAELGTLAAAAADQLSSPLATMAVVVGELRDGLAPPAERDQALEVIARQIETCKQVSSRMLTSAGYSRAERGGKVAADKFCAAIVDKCQLMQPWMSVQCRYEGGTLPAPDIVAESSLEQAVLALLEGVPGAAQRVEIAVWWDDQCLHIQLCDCAPPSRADAPPYAGAPLFARTAPAPADRLHLLMAKATICRFGGSVEDQVRADGRASVRLSLALFGVSNI
jgi:two-component system sensor histidine kinase RegB